MATSSLSSAGCYILSHISEGVSAGKALGGGGGGGRGRRKARS